MNLFGFLWRSLATIFLPTLVYSHEENIAPWIFVFDSSNPRTEGTMVGPGTSFSVERGYGFDLSTSPQANGKPFFFSLNVPEGNYRVTVTFGSQVHSSDNVVKAESRQLMLEHVTTLAGESIERSFIVNVRNSRLPAPEKNAPGGAEVVLNERERGILRWDEKLTLEFNGKDPAVRRVLVEPVNVTTIFLAGDSTVADQPAEPTASWGQMLPRFFPGAAIANHAESGETMKSFISGLRLAKILSEIKSGDFLLIQFGHNDSKRQWLQTYVDARTTYKAYLRVFVAEARFRGATPVLVTSMQRRSFDSSGKIANSHGYYPQAVREVATEEKVALIDLDRMSVSFYEALGPLKAPVAFSGGRDPTHHSNYGAYELAKCVAQGVRNSGSEMYKLIAPDFLGFDPAEPDIIDRFDMPSSPAGDPVVIRGN